MIRQKAQRIRKVVDLEDCIADIFSSVRRLVEVPTTMIMILAVLIITFTHSEDLTSGFLSKLVREHENNQVLVFIKNHFRQALGVAVFGAVITDLPRNVNKIVVLVATCFWTFALPPFNIYQYACQAVVLHSYFRVYLRKSKMILFVIAIGIFVVGHSYLGSFKHPSPVTIDRAPRDAPYTPPVGGAPNLVTTRSATVNTGTKK